MQAETDFFLNDPYFRALKKDQWGIDTLAAKLSRELVSHIKVNSKSLFR